MSTPGFEPPVVGVEEVIGHRRRRRRRLRTLAELFREPVGPVADDEDRRRHDEDENKNFGDGRRNRLKPHRRNFLNSSLVLNLIKNKSASECRHLIVGLAQFLLRTEIFFYNKTFQVNISFVWNQLERFENFPETEEKKITFLEIFGGSVEH